MSASPELGRSIADLILDEVKSAVGTLIADGSLAVVDSGEGTVQRVEVTVKVVDV